MAETDGQINLSALGEAPGMQILVNGGSRPDMSFGRRIYNGPEMHMEHLKMLNKALESTREALTNYQPTTNAPAEPQA